MAGCAAMLEIDIKKVIALSTLSQLGIIIIVIGAGAPILAYFHLLSHAFFKAILFICAGMIIHNIKDYQDIRKIGLTTIFMPIITSVILVANISLCGLPFLRGTSVSKSRVSKPGVSKPGVSKTSISNTSISKTRVSVSIVGISLSISLSFRLSFSLTLAIVSQSGVSKSVVSTASIS